jgi:ABC-type sugar transport system ATPase subunit
MTAYLSVEGIEKSYGRTKALSAVDLAIARGEFLALLGPSGCGKTTLLRIVAGLLSSNGGRLRLDGQDITDLPPWKRDIGLVFQNYALFPHMSVRQNVGFGLEMRKVGRDRIGAMVDEALDVVRMRAYADRRPSELSGGQQQRVAIARAIAIKPRLLLLDEPLSNLDAVLRNSVRVELRELHDRIGITTVMVTHDQSEALTLADRVAVMSEGQVQQYGTAHDIYENPATTFVAGFVGNPPASLLNVDHAADGELSVSGRPWSAPPAVAAALATFRRSHTKLALRPETLTLVPKDTPHALKGTIRTVEYMGSDRLVHIDLGGQLLLVRVTGMLPDLGPEVGIAIPDLPPLIFASDSGRRLSYTIGER